MCVDYRKSISIEEDGLKVLAAWVKRGLDNGAHGASCWENALSIGFERMDFLDFSAERPMLMSKIVNEVQLGL